jgi:hypothetical protein
VTPHADTSKAAPYRVDTIKSTQLAGTRQGVPPLASPHRIAPKARRCGPCEGCPEDHCATCSEAPMPEPDQEPFRFTYDRDERSHR